MEKAYGPTKGSVNGEMGGCWLRLWSQEPASRLAKPLHFPHAPLPVKLRFPMLLLCLLAAILCAVSSPANGSVGYTLDAVGNRLSRLSTLNSVLSTASTCTTNDWLASDTVDNNGNTTASALGNDVYDSENRLINRTTTLNSQLSTISILYDGDGNRVRKSVTDGTNTVTTWYLVDDRNPTGYAQVLEEHVSLNSQPPTLNRVYTYGHDLLAQDRWSGTGWQASYYGYDGHGSVRFLTDATGQLTDSYEYDAFGKLIARTPNSELQTPNLYLYAGEQWDADLGLYYNRARYLNPDTGRFWNMDTFEGNTDDPLSLHKYLYTANNPVNMVDPSGHDGELGSTLAATAISGAMMNMVIGAPFRVYHAAERLRIGVDFGTVVNETLFGVLTDGAIGAVLPGLFSYVGRGLSAGISAIRASQTFVRASDSVWNMGIFARGWEIERRILGGTRRLVPNFPVIDDLVNGVATSIKSIDLTAATYKSAAKLTRMLEGYASKLSRFNGDSARYAGELSVVTANQIEQRVLLVAVEDGAATIEQMQVINEFVAKAKLLWPNIKVLIAPVP
ncbi:MAG: RHS repeat-associated core domain-containing protein [Limisphaerales bacterium]